MKDIGFKNAPPIYMEITQDFLRVLREDAGAELPLERADNGRLTVSGREKLTEGLQAFLKQQKSRGRARAFCAIGATGVSIRRLSLPASAREELQRLLLLQIEAEFPLPPDQLAWGYQVINESTAVTASARQEVLIAAVKKEILEDYIEVFARCGIDPVFTPAAMARSALCPQPGGTHATLDIGRRRSELMAFEMGIPGQSRVMPWGEEATRDDMTLDAMARNIASVWTGNRLYLTGEPGFRRDLAEQLARRFGGNFECARVGTTSGNGSSAAVLGLKKIVAENENGPALVFQVQPKAVETRFHWKETGFRKLAVAAAVLVAAILLLPYAEAIVLKPFLARKLAALKSDRSRLPAIDKELDFLQYLQQDQPPCLDAVYLFAKSAPQGMRLDSLSMNGRGEVSLRGSMQNFQQLADFRAKLIESGFFSAVSVEEQTPSPDGQKVNVRLSAQWVSAPARAALSFGPTPEEIEKAKNTPHNPAGGGPTMPGMTPGGMPPNIAMPAGARAGRRRNPANPDS